MKRIYSPTLRTMMVENDDITVTVVGGITILSGTVNNYQKLPETVSEAFHAGAAVVRNELTDEDGADLQTDYFYRDSYDWQ